MLAAEIQALPEASNVKISKAGVTFSGSARTGLAAILWLRTSLRVMENISPDLVANTVVSSTGAARITPPLPPVLRSKEDLYAYCSAVDWLALLSHQQTLKCDTVLGRDVSPQLAHSHFSSLTLKNSIIDQFREAAQQQQEKEVEALRPSVDLEDPDLSLLLYLHKGKATLYRVWSGESSMHKRGYRQGGAIHKAALRETTAAAL